MVIGNPASGGSSAPELLPTFWRVLSQALPPGAAVTSMRDVVYFRGYGSADALIVLSIYAVMGAAVAMVVASVRAARSGKVIVSTQQGPPPGAVLPEAKGRSAPA